MSEYVYAGLTSQTIDLFIRDSSSTTGQGLTGLAYNSGSLVASYRKGATGSRVAITLATQTVTGAYSSGGFVEIDATNMPGVYRLDLPNAAVDTAGFVTVFLKGAANMVPVALRIDCRPLPADVKQIGGNTQSATDLKDFADTGYDPATHKLAEAVELDSSARVKLHGTQEDYAPLKASDYTAPLTAASTRTALGMAAADLDTQLDAILAAASAGAGTGARTVTITVNDGTTVLQNAVVRFTEGSNTYRAITNASGVATFNLDDATYTVAVSKVGYYYAGTTMVVNGTETATYSMTAVNVTPGTGDLTTGYLTCLDEEGTAEQGVSVRCQVVQVPASGTGFAYDSAVQLATSDADGLVEFPMVKGARYLVWRGSIKPPQGITPILISASAGSTTALGSLIGD